MTDHSWMEIQVFPMVNQGEDCRLTENRNEEPDFYDVLVTLHSTDSSGEIDVVEEHENLTLDQASTVFHAMVDKYPNADQSWLNS